MGEKKNDAIQLYKLSFMHWGVCGVKLSFNYIDMYNVEAKLLRLNYIL